MCNYCFRYFVKGYVIKESGVMYCEDCWEKHSLEVYYTLYLPDRTKEFKESYNEVLKNKHYGNGLIKK